MNEENKKRNEAATNEDYSEKGFDNLFKRLQSILFIAFTAPKSEYPLKPIMILGYGYIKIKSQEDALSRAKELMEILRIGKVSVKINNSETIEINSNDL